MNTAKKIQKKEFKCNNMTTNLDFVSVCKHPQHTLKEKIYLTIKDLFTEVHFEDGFLYAKGDIPVLLTAHMDTVHKETIREFDERHGILYSPQGIGGDDRCGIYMILKLLEMGYRPSVLFCEDEEIGGIGAQKFARTKHIEDLAKLKYFIALDRRGNNDAVFYDCNNASFKTYITQTTGYKEAQGSWTDICTLSKHTDVASVNLSCGYYREHTLDEYVVLSEMYNTIEVVEDLLSETFDVAQFDYEPKKLWDDYFWDYEYEGGDIYEITFDTNNGSESEIYEAFSEYEALGKFFVDYPNVTFKNVMDITIN